MNVAEEVYKIVGELPREEKYDLASQIRRSAVSIPSNIAEGAGRSSDKEFAYHLNVAMGSAYELETQILLAEKLYNKKDIFEPSSVYERLHQLQKMLYKLIIRYKVRA